MDAIEPGDEGLQVLVSRIGAALKDVGLRPGMKLAAPATFEGVSAQFRCFELGAVHGEARVRDQSGIRANNQQVAQKNPLSSHPPWAEEKILTRKQAHMNHRFTAAAAITHGATSAPPKEG